MKLVPLNKVLIIQTAFLGDVVLATSLIESIHAEMPETEIHFLVRKGNETLLKAHPYVKKIWVYDKKKRFFAILSLIAAFRKERFDAILNLHRFLSSGLIAVCSGAKFTSGFNKNPLSLFYSMSVEHKIPFPKQNGTSFLHETERNHQVLSSWRCFFYRKPKLYPETADFEKVKSLIEGPFVVFAPDSIWPTKRLPEKKWIELIANIPKDYSIYFIGAYPDKDRISDLISKVKERKGMHNLAGSLSLLQSAALMSMAVRNFVNDSGPLHLASAMDAPVTAFFCSTIPQFGFGPLSSDSMLVEVKEKLSCRPCGIHGLRECPLNHFNCGNDIQINSNLLKFKEFLSN